MSGTGRRTVAQRYELIVELGRGAMGVVWRARDLTIDRDVALKQLLLPEHLSADERETLRERVLREARTAGRLDDPSVIMVHDVVSDHDQTYIVMELVDAVNLARLIELHGPMAPDFVANVARQTLSALRSAHSAGVVHRDVKPSNLMVRPDGRVKLADFGIAQSLDDPRLTTAGDLLGSPAYMSPERLHGHDASPASDLWALGVTLAHAVEGHNPYERSTTPSTINAVLHETPRITKVDGPLADVVHGLLAPDPAARLTADQAMAVLDHGHVAMRPQPKPRTKIVVMAAVLLVAVVAGALVSVVLRPEGAPGSASPSSSTVPSSPAANDGASIQDGAIVTFGRSGQVTGWALGGAQCAKGFLTEGKSVPASTPCEQEHDIQLFAAATPFYETINTAPYPGESWLRDFAEHYCAEQFSSNRIVFDGDRSSALARATLIPTEHEWNARTAATWGHREILCVVWKKDRTALLKSIVAER